LTGQLYIAGPSAIISTTLGYAAAVQEDNPVQAVAVETIVNFTAKPIGIISKGAASTYEGHIRNGIDATGQVLENEYKKI
jgi:hypothetical protein